MRHLETHIKKVILTISRPPIKGPIINTFIHKKQQKMIKSINMTQILTYVRYTKSAASLLDIMHQSVKFQRNNELTDAHPNVKK